MKVCLIQPHYSLKYEEIGRCFEEQMKLLEQCDESLDLIVLPESADVPAYAPTREMSEASVRKYNEPLLAAAAETAVRCRAIVCVNARSRAESGLYRNTTWVFDREGRVAGQYHKQHLVPDESDPAKLCLESGYTWEWSEPAVVTVEGLRLCFLTCYDFYYYEAYSNIARQKPDLIIGCSHQRSDSHAYSETTARFLAYQTNAYVLRASVSLDENSDIGGGSLVAAPDGSLVLAMKSRVGLGICEIDPAKKFFKAAGFGNPPSSHFDYVEKGRRPWKYRPAGSAVCLPDARVPYPRICAHRGFSAVAPENSLPAFGAAVALGADEIEFDLRLTADGEVVSVHDARLDRISDGEGRAEEKTLAELRKLDFGVRFGESFRGLGIVRLEDILRKFACHTIMNVHLKAKGDQPERARELVRKTAELIRKYDCVPYCYFMSNDDAVQRMAAEEAPDIARCQGAGSDDRWAVVDRAIENGCTKVQLFKPYFDQAMIDRAKAAGIKVNVFWSDDPEEARRFLEMGCDTILTNEYLKVRSIF